MAAAEGMVEAGVDRAGVRCGLVSWLLWRDLSTPALVCTVEAGGVPCWRMAERTGDGFLDERGLPEGIKVVEACLRRVGIEDIELDEACRTVTGLLSLLDALRGTWWASAMAVGLGQVSSTALTTTPCASWSSRVFALAFAFAFAPIRFDSIFRWDAEKPRLCFRRLCLFGEASDAQARAKTPVR